MRSIALAWRLARTRTYLGATVRERRHPRPPSQCLRAATPDVYSKPRNSRHMASSYLNLRGELRLRPTHAALSPCSLSRRGRAGRAGRAVRLSAFCPSPSAHIAQRVSHSLRGPPGPVRHCKCPSRGSASLAISARGRGSQRRPARPRCGRRPASPATSPTHALRGDCLH